MNREMNQLFNIIVFNKKASMIFKKVLPDAILF